MDSATKRFMQSHADKFTGTVLDVGSLDVNGSLRDVINVTVGIDMRSGRGVDVVCPVEDILTEFEQQFDACVSAGTLEHVEDWKAFVNNTWDIVRDGGWLVMTMASMGKGRHNYPNDYWRFTLDQIKQLYPTAEWVGEVGPVSIGWVVQKGSVKPDVTVTPKAVG